jgi:hypothetical protein
MESSLDTHTSPTQEHDGIVLTGYALPALDITVDTTRLHTQKPPGFNLG